MVETAAGLWENGGILRRLMRNEVWQTANCWKNNVKRHG